MRRAAVETCPPAARRAGFIGTRGSHLNLAGARGAKKLIAINKDGDSPIMAAADYAVLGDMHEIVPAISAEIRRRRASA